MRCNLVVSALIMVSICFFAVHSFASSSELNSTPTSEGYGGKSTWPCCDDCGTCTKSIPPLCTCQDIGWSCHPECKKCVQTMHLIYPPFYQCMDRIANYCEKKCHPKYDSSS